MPLPEPKTAEQVSPAPRGGIVPAMRRLGLSSCVFGIVFLTLALSLTKLVSPDRFPVRVGGNIVRLHDLEAEAERLRSKETELQSVRAGLTMEKKAPVLSAARDIAGTFVPVGEAMQLLEEARESFQAGVSDPISFPDMEFSAAAGTITIRGSVQDQKGRSVQLLASFVDQLRDFSIFRQVSEPEYIAEPLEDGGTVTPFAITIHLAGA